MTRSLDDCVFVDVIDRGLKERGFICSTSSLRLRFCIDETRFFGDTLRNNSEGLAVVFYRVRIEDKICF